MKTLTATDRKSLIRTASTMRKGDPTRRGILSGLFRLGSVVQLEAGKNGLTWDPRERQFSIEASQIRTKWTSVQILNPKTGNSGGYINPQPTHDREGDIVLWTLQGPYNTTLVIWND